LLINLQRSENTAISIITNTNVPWCLDNSLRRRIYRPIYVPLPTAPDRVAMIQKYMGRLPHNISSEEFQQLGDITEGYSGAELNLIIQETISDSIRKTTSATHFKIISMNGGPEYVPCSSEDQGAVEMNDSSPDNLIPMDVSFADVLKVLHQNPPRASRADIERFIQQKFDWDY